MSVMIGLAAGLVLFSPPVIHAQDNNNNNGGGDGEISSNAAGVYIDAQGVFRTQVHPDPTGQLTRERMASARSALSNDVRAFSKLRKVSLNRLEAALMARQGALTEEMKYLAGLLRVKYVFYYPETKDIVIAGPAEGWYHAPSDRVLGLSTRRPVIQLQDAAAALRAFPPGGDPTPLVGCSIDPTAEGLAATQQLLASTAPNQYNPEPFIIALQNAMGLQTVRVDGVPPGTRMAQVMVEADYRMKLIGINLERPPVQFASFVDRARPGEISRNALIRWYFVPDYQCVRVSEDKLAMELVGDGVKLVGENELVSATGKRQVVGGASRASLAFTTAFTKKYPQLAERSAVYADLRNMIDLLVATAFIQQEDYYGQAGWSMPFLGNEKAYAVETYTVPKTVATTVNAIRKGRSLMTPIAGGIQIKALQALETDNLLQDKDGKVSQLHEKTKLPPAPDRWWWD
ncbi:MAG: DUF1598 domain-containing protein [Pirellulales bacterium]|nr:DUF1598 domain-containing protein [Pirellulales bacterium]